MFWIYTFLSLLLLVVIILAYIRYRTGQHRIQEEVEQIADRRRELPRRQTTFRKTSKTPALAPVLSSLPNVDNAKQRRQRPLAAVTSKLSSSHQRREPSFPANFPALPQKEVLLASPALEEKELILNEPPKRSPLSASPLEKSPSSSFSSSSSERSYLPSTNREESSSDSPAQSEGNSFAVRRYSLSELPSSERSSLYGEDEALASRKSSDQSSHASERNSLDRRNSFVSKCDSNFDSASCSTTPESETRSLSGSTVRRHLAPYLCACCREPADSDPGTKELHPSNEVGHNGFIEIAQLQQRHRVTLTSELGCEGHVTRVNLSYTEEKRHKAVYTLLEVEGLLAKISEGTALVTRLDSAGPKIIYRFLSSYKAESKVLFLTLLDQENKRVELAGSLEILFLLCGKEGKSCPDKEPDYCHPGGGGTGMCR